MDKPKEIEICAVGGAVTSICINANIHEEIVENKDVDGNIVSTETRWAWDVVGEAWGLNLTRYADVVARAIRCKYSVDDEIAILRQQSAKPKEYEEYNTFCEAVKTEAHEAMGI